MPARAQLCHHAFERRTTDDASVTPATRPRPRTHNVDSTARYLALLRVGGPNPAGRPRAARSGPGRGVRTACSDTNRGRGTRTGTETADTGRGRKGSRARKRTAGAQGGGQVPRDAHAHKKLEERGQDAQKPGTRGREQDEDCHEASDRVAVADQRRLCTKHCLNDRRNCIEGRTQGTLEVVPLGQEPR